MPPLAEMETVAAPTLSDASLCGAVPAKEALAVTLLYSTAAALWLLLPLTTLVVEGPSLMLTSASSSSDTLQTPFPERLRRDSGRLVSAGIATTAS